MSPVKKRRTRRGDNVVTGRRRRVYQGAVPAASEPVSLDAVQEELLEEVLALLTGDESEKNFKMRFILARGFGERGKTKAVDAMLSLDPKMTRRKAIEEASRLNKKIREDLGVVGMAALNGVTRRAIENILRGAAGAMFVKEFLDLKTGEIKQGKEREDWIPRLRTAELMMRYLGIGKDSEEKQQPVVVQIVSYAPATSVPWPGGGRVVNGALVQTVGVPALPPARPDFTGGKGVRDD